MLQTIREHTQGWIAGTIISIIILTFALWGIHSYFIGGAANPDIAQVNGVGISKSQLSMAYERLKRQIQSQFGNSNPFAGKDDLLKKRALQGLIDNEVLKQAAINQGFMVSDAQINNFLQTMPEFQVDGQFSMERFQQVLSSSMLSVGEFLDLIRNNLLINQPRIGVVSTSVSLPDETSSTISLINQERDFDYLTIPNSVFMSQPVTIAPDKIQAYYNDHKKEFMTPEQVSVEYLQLSLSDISAKLNPSDDVLQSYYHENIASYTLPVQWKLIDLEIPLAATATPDEAKKAQDKANVAFQAIMNGQDFAKVVKGYEGSLTSKGWMTLTQIPAELQKTVSSLTQVGQVSKPFRTSKAMVIVKAVAIQQPTAQTFDEVKSRIKDNYLRQHAEENLAAARDRLADLTYEHPDSLQAASSEMGLPVQTTGLFSKEAGGKDISQNKKIRDVAFSQDVIKNQNNSDVIQINPETIIVLRVKSHISAKVQPLANVSAQIATILKTQEANVRADKASQDMLKKLNAGGDPQEVAAINKVSWKKAGLIGRFANKLDAAIAELAFRLPNPVSNHNKPIFGLTRLPNGFAIVRLNAVKPGVIADKKQYALYAEQIQNSEGMLEYELYKLSQTNQAKISGA